MLTQTKNSLKKRKYQMFKLSNLTKQNNSSLEPGNFIAIGKRVADMGTQTSTYEGKTNDARKCLISWEVFRPDGEEPYMHSQFYTMSIHPKSGFRKLINSWNGNPLSVAEWKEFDMTWVLGRGCNLSLDYSDASDAYKLSIKEISPLDVNESSNLGGDHTGSMFMLGSPDLEVFNTLSKGVQEMIMKSPEWQALPFAADWKKHLVDQKLAKISASKTM
jgi:hypothetical protein